MSSEYRIGGAAQYLAAATGKPNITVATVRVWADVGLLTPALAPTSAQMRFAQHELDHFIARYPYGSNPPPTPYLRVSLNALRPSPVYTPGTPPRVWRTMAGYDHINRDGLTTTARARAITGVWALSSAVADRVVSERLPLIGVVKGIITPHTVFWPVSWFREAGTRIAFNAGPPPPHAWTVSTGALVDVVRGPEAHLVGS